MITPHRQLAYSAPDAVPTHLAAVIPRINAMIDSGDCREADALLRTALAGWDAEQSPPHPFLIAAAHSYVRLLPVSDIASAQQWARYARYAARDVYGQADQRTADAIESLCRALSETLPGDPTRHRELVQARDELIEVCSRVHGPDADATLRSRSRSLEARRAFSAACARHRADDPTTAWSR